MLEQLLRVLSPEGGNNDLFTAGNMHPDAVRVYGGQVLAQCIASAVATVPEDRVLHSQHAYFCARAIQPGPSRWR